MFINKQPRINVHRDSVTSALLKKTKNKDLSEKTLNKLVKIANSHIGLTKSEARSVFIENKPIEKSTHSMKLALELKKVLSQCSNYELRDRIDGFVRNCSPTTFINTKDRVPTHEVNMNAADFVETYSAYIGPTIGEGGEGIVVKDAKNNHKVFKIFKDSAKNNEIVNQAESFKMFYGKKSAHVMCGRAIYMDKIGGTPLSQMKEFPVDAVIKFQSLIDEMIEKRCAPSDMSEGNFHYDAAKNEFFPVDISTNKENEVSQDGLDYIKNYIKSRVLIKHE